MKNQTIEQQVAKAVLQLADSVKVGNTTYPVAPPTIATLILASEAVSRLPHVKLDSENITEETLNIAKDCAPLGEIIAILVLGARGLSETRTRTVQRVIPRLWGLYHKTVEETVTETIDRKAELAKELLETMTPQELHSLAARLLKRMQIADFFGLTTFLTEINLLRQTKVEN